MQQRQRAFTLIELLVVIAIVALLASIVLVALNGARVKSRDAKRRADLKELANALELYYSDNSSYPSTGDTYWSATSFGAHGTGSTGYIPGLVPTYIGVLPVDPRDGDGTHRYIYSGNGAGYMLIATLENCTLGAGNLANDPMVRPNYPNDCSIAVYTPDHKAY